MTGTGVISKKQAQLELTMLDAEYGGASFDEFVVRGLKKGVPAELLTRLKALWETTRTVAGQAISIGKIVVSKIIEFLNANPEIPVMAAMGAAVGLMVLAIPLIGPLLAPITIPIGAAIGAAYGASMAEGQKQNSSLGQLAEAAYAGVTALARKFFELLILVLDAVREDIANERSTP